MNIDYNFLKFQTEVERVYPIFFGLEMLIFGLQKKQMNQKTIDFYFLYRNLSKKTGFSIYVVYNSSYK
jgi:hypothetical protein